MGIGEVAALRSGSPAPVELASPIAMRRLAQVRQGRTRSCRAGVTTASSAVHYGMTPRLTRQIREMLARLEALPEDRRAWIIRTVKEYLSGRKTPLH